MLVGTLAMCNVFLLLVYLCVLLICTSLSPQGARFGGRTIKYFSEGWEGRRIFYLFVLRQNIKYFNSEEAQRNERLFSMLL